MNAMETRRRVFVTGGTGAIGRPLIDELLTLGADVTVLIHRRPMETPGVKIVRGDLNTVSPEWFVGVDTVYHLAAALDSDAGEDYLRLVNVDGTRNLVEALAGLPRPPRLIFASTIAVYAPDTEGRALTIDSPPLPLTAYGRSKWEGEIVASRYPRCVIGRIPMVVGPHDRFSRRFLKMAARRVFPVARGRFSAVHERELAVMLRMLADEAHAEGRVFLLTDGREYSWRNVARHYENRVGKKAFHPPIPGFLLHPWLFRRLGNADAAFFLGRDWRCEPVWPSLYTPRAWAFSAKEDP